MLRTSDGRLTVIMLTFLFYVTSPVLFYWRLSEELKSGAFPPESDSIGLPMAGFIVLWLIALPFVVIFCGLVEILGREYYGTDN